MCSFKIEGLECWGLEVFWVLWSLQAQGLSGGPCGFPASEGCPGSSHTPAHSHPPAARFSWEIQCVAFSRIVPVVTPWHMVVTMLFSFSSFSKFQPIEGPLMLLQFG